MSMESACKLRPAAIGDAAALADIYNHYVTQTIVTFEETPISAAAMAVRLDEAGAAGLPWLVAEDQGTILGYAYASRWKGRCAYRFAVEVTVYLAPGQGGRGLGSALYQRLLEELASANMHTAIGGIALPNEASVRLHEKLGFERVALFRQVGFKFGRWIDVGYWQRML